MSDTPPDHLSSNPRSPFYDEALLARGVGIRFKGVERRDVEEYCRSEGWIRVALGKKVDRRGQPLTVKLSGEVEAWFERPAAGTADAAETAEPTTGGEAAGEAAGASTPAGTPDPQG